MVFNSVLSLSSICLGRPCFLLISEKKSNSQALFCCQMPTFKALFYIHIYIYIYLLKKLYK